MPFSLTLIYCFTLQMLKAPPLKSLVLHISLFQDRSEREVFNKIFDKVIK